MTEKLNELGWVKENEGKTDAAQLEKHRNNASAKLDAAVNVVHESEEALEAAVEDLSRRQGEWNNVYERVCLEIQREEE